MLSPKKKPAGFYAVTKERPFFGELTDFMSSGKIFAWSSKPKAPSSSWRDNQGANDPRKPPPHHPPRPRHQHRNNCTHGSDAPETAAFEISYFFSGLELTDFSARSSAAARYPESPAPVGRSGSQPANSLNASE